MNLQTRLARIEKLIDPNACLGCGSDKSLRPQVSREQAEAALAGYLPHCASRQAALRLLAEDFPACARALGFNGPYPSHCCGACGADRRTPQQRAEDAEAALAGYLPFVDRETALEMLREDFPAAAGWLRDSVSVRDVTP